MKKSKEFIEFVNRYKKEHKIVEGPVALPENIMYMYLIYMCEKITNKKIYRKKMRKIENE